MLRILVADDVPMVRVGLKLLLETHEGWSVCGEAGDGEDAAQKAFALAPRESYQ
jgi:DNA-binding NarL/FixJ family response regulator